MKGQASLEYLALSLVSLAMLALSISALGMIKAGAEKALRLAMLASSASRLADAANEACAMGNGNERSVAVSVPVSIEPGKMPDSPGYAVRLASADGSMAVLMLCEPEGGGRMYGMVRVRNERGTIIFRGQ